MEENIRVNLHDLGFDNEFLDTTPKAQTAKEKVGGWTSSELKILCFKGHYQENEKITQKMGENICKSYISDRWLVCKIYKELLQLNNKKTSSPIKKWVKKLKRRFSKKVYRWSINTWKDARHHWSSGKCKNWLRSLHTPLRWL